MKLMKKWLLPALTCLIVMGAAVLPQQLSQARDARQLWAVHAEELSADALPAYEPPSLTDRLVLYADRYSAQHPILSSNESGYADHTEKLCQGETLRELLDTHGIVPAYFFEEFNLYEHFNISRLLLWDPAKGTVIQTPSVFYLFTWTYYTSPHNKSVSVSVDEETGLPIEITIFDTNMSQWLPYGWDELQDVTDQYFDMMGLVCGVDIDPMESKDPSPKNYLSLYYSVAGTNLRYRATRNPTSLSFSLELNETEPMVFDG